MADEKQIERIRRMEARLIEAEAAVRTFSDARERFAAAQRSLWELDAYLGSEDWRQDREADETGRLPSDLRRGVLSEDGIYDLLDDNREEMRAALLMAAEYFGEMLK